ncbi:DUF3365 domain-containing protein [Sulfurimonas aquatica]|uniref:DUF3365 domain-containing protein n=1 Tax=Sulfurimonas aquatica TaxID=2672570 RepID=A0A975B0Q8_9BACT|nr:DUF3365 domain-containing protein [Sulfurimonas aquatica]QSZ42109.1 DUF3365 domain-containing protein [Sulfurimonas aquatica]
MKIIKYITSISLTASILLAAPVNKQEEEMKSVIELGDKGSMMLASTLMKKMKKKIKGDKVMQAFEFCSNEAYTLTESVNKKLPNGVKVKRVSSKFRSPANAPLENEQKILDAIENLKEANLILPEYFIEKIDNHTYNYYKPLLINNKACLKCHGTLKDIEVKRAISQRYPIDNAVGYEMGDLRGAIIVTIDKSVK